MKCGSRKRYEVLVLIAFMLLGIGCIEPPQQLYYSFATDSAVVMSTDVKWVYKEVNGVTYKRALNTKTNEWLTDWIIVKKGKSNSAEP